MSTWIVVHQSLPTHRKTLAMCDLLDIEPVDVVGHLTMFWMWCVDNAPEGLIKNTGARVIAIASNWRGDAKKYVDSLITAGFLDQNDQGLVVHNWPMYMGRLIALRARNAERMQKARALHVPRTSDARYDDFNARVMLPDLTQPNRTKPDQTMHTAASAADLFDEFAARITTDGANAGAVLADAVSNQYGIECRDFGRLGKLAKDHGATSVLDRIFGLTATWSGKGNPVNYIAAAMNGHANDRKNGNGHSAEKLPTNHQPADLPEVIDWTDLSADEIKRQEDEKDRIAFEQRLAKLGVK